jgi:hypothetical protein
MKTYDLRRKARVHNPLPGRVLVARDNLTSRWRFLCVDNDIELLWRCTAPSLMGGKAGETAMSMMSIAFVERRN